MENEKDEVRGEVVKDLGEAYNIQVIQLQEEIKEAWEDCVVNKLSLIAVHHSINSLFKKIYPKLDKTEIVCQKKLRKILSKLRPFDNKMVSPYFGASPEAKIKLNKKIYSKCVSLLTKREIHLNECLERIGLTAKQSKKKMRY